MKERLPDCRRRRIRVRASAAAGLLLLAGVALPPEARSLSDPADPIYRHLAVWEQRGYFAPLPVLRPYAPQLVVELLRQVAAAGARPDRELAAAYLGALVPENTDRSLGLPPITASVHGGLTAGTLAAPGPRLLFGGALESTSLFGQFAYSAAFRYWWESDAEPALRYRPRQQPVFPSAGPNFPVAGLRFHGKEDLRATAAVGSPRLSLQAGFSQGAFGVPLYDSIVLGAGAPPAAHLAAVFRGDRLAYSAAFMELVAEQAVRPDGSRYRLKGSPGTTGFPSKYLMLHALQWHALPWLSLDAFSSALFGARLSLYSLLPMAFVTEPFTLNYDNTLAGIGARARLPWGLSAQASLYVDDYNVFAHGEFNPSPLANKTAGQAAVSWVLPAASGVVGAVSLDYLYVAPYMYTHSSHQPINYLTYTHRKAPLANALQPNSDQWTLAALATPAPGLDLELTVRAIRHGNASARLAERGRFDDGSIWDDGYDAEGTATFVGPTPFLEGLLEHVYQLELAAGARFPVLSLLKLRTRISYAIEHVENDALQRGATATNHRFGVRVAVEL